ncbi:MAG TPA: CDP-alcohol phosphatidyltransferase family protein, partial [Gemmatales bacterium]|nr:CDP-alcohol phosphatidyltransferase family protein [Gemmatales bacterium]
MATSTTTDLAAGGTLRQPLRRDPSPFNIPNQLTALRFVLAIVLYVLISYHEWIACGLVFAAAAVTDFLDGYIARLQGIVSTLGRNLDPLVDKVLICGAYICLVPFDVQFTGLAVWMVVIVVSRELLVTSLRSYMEQHHAAFGADWMGKIKMALQCGVLLIVFWILHLQQTRPADLTPGWFTLRDVLVYGMVISTVASGVTYLWQAFQVYRREQAEARPNPSPAGLPPPPGPAPP